MTEIFESLVWLVMLALWALANWWGRRKRPVSAAPPVEREPAVDAPPRSGGRDGLRDLFEQLREALDPMPAEVAEPVEPPAEGSPARLEAELPPGAAMGFSEPELEGSVSRPPERIEGLEPRRRRKRNALVTETLRDLRGGGRALRRAVLLREILGPPVALRDEIVEPTSGGPR